jgi:hypothetical protein
MYDNTVKQLEQFDIPYNQLVMGKPLGIYVDADAIRTLDDVV